MISKNYFSHRGFELGFWIEGHSPTVASVGCDHGRTPLPMSLTSSWPA